jgi:5-formyltetrahydrofolate cyclo-ligase
MSAEKSALRQQLLAQRQQLSPVLYEQRSTQICQQLQTFLAAQVPAASSILAYWPYRQEPDISILFRSPDYQWVLPRCLPDRELAWHRWCWGDLLVANRYGLLEPSVTAPLVDLAEVSVLMLPAVAIDQQGYRLGYGGGYFDRLLSNENWQPLMTIGVVFDFAYLPLLPVDNWDRPVAAVCTESGMVVF